MAHLHSFKLYAIIFLMLTKQKKLKIIKVTRIHDTDTGSPDVQVAILSKRIEDLANHLKINKKDKHSRKGLLQMVASRQTLLSYLQKNEPKRYASLTKKLNIKKKA